jgi:hypothetical protein
MAKSGRRKKGLTFGTHMPATEKEKRRFTRMCKPKGNTSFGEYAKASQVGWSERGDDGQQGVAGRLGRILGEDSN